MTGQVKSININSVFDKKTVKENMNKPLVTVSGFADDFFYTMTKFGEQVGFKGDFVATNLLTGEMYESNAAFLPKQLAGTLVKKLESNPGQSIELTATLQAVESDKNSHGYAWIAEAPMTEQRLSRREALRQQALMESNKVKALAAPVKEAPEKGKKSA